MSLPRATLAAIHVAKKDRGMDEDTYRDFLELHAGVRSAADLDEKGARAVMLAFENAGFVKTSKPVRGGLDRRPIVRKAQALWIMLWNLDEVASGNDKALTAFAQRITGKQALKFCTNGEVGKVVEALKDWCLRAGVDPDTTSGLVDPLRRLIAEQRKRLIAIGVEWVAHSVNSYEEAMRVANMLGAELRQSKKAPSQNQDGEAHGNEAKGRPGIG